MTARGLRVHVLDLLHSPGARRSLTDSVVWEQPLEVTAGRVPAGAVMLTPAPGSESNWNAMPGATVAAPKLCGPRNPSAPSRIVTAGSFVLLLAKVRVPLPSLISVVLPPRPMGPVAWPSPTAAAKSAAPSMWRLH